jgi:hypothetical protein
LEIGGGSELSLGIFTKGRESQHAIETVYLNGIASPR